MSNTVQCLECSCSIELGESVYSHNGEDYYCDICTVDNALSAPRGYTFHMWNCACCGEPLPTKLERWPVALRREDGVLEVICRLCINKPENISNLAYIHLPE